MNGERKLIGQIRLGMDNLDSDINKINQKLENSLGKKNGKNLLELDIKIKDVKSSILDGLKQQIKDALKDIDKLNNKLFQVTQASQKAGQSANNVYNLSVQGKTTREIQNLNQQGNVTGGKVTTQDSQGLKTTYTVDADNRATSAKRELTNANTEFQRKLNEIMNTYNSLGESERKQISNIQNTIAALDNLRKQYTVADSEFGTILKRRHEMETKLKASTSVANAPTSNTNANSQFKQELNTILNTYNSLNLAQRNEVINIQNTIKQLDVLSQKYKAEDNELKAILDSKNKLQAAEARLTNSRQTSSSQPFTGKELYINQNLENLINARKTDQINAAQFAQRAQVYTKQDNFSLLTLQNQIALTNQLNSAKRETAKIEEQQKKNQLAQNLKPLNDQINAYRSLSTEQQKFPSELKKIIAEYDKLIAKYRNEEEILKRLISERKNYQRQLDSNKASAQKEYEQMSQDIRGNSVLGGAAVGVMGSGDRRASVMDKFQNSLIYSMSGAAIGQTTAAIQNAIGVNAKYEEGLVNLSRTMSNVTNDDLKSMGQEAIKMSKEFGVPLEEVQNAMTELTRAGIKNKEQLQDMTKNVLTGINTTEIKDAEQMTGFLISTIKQLGMEFKDTELIIDGWNKLADNYAVKSNDFAEAIQRSGTASKALGVDLHQLNAMVVVLGERTQKSGSEIGNALKTLQTRIFRPETVAKLEDYGIKVKKNEKEFNTFKDVLMQVNQALEKYTDGSIASVEILDAMGGAWRKNDISILAKNWGEVERVQQESMSALGYSAKENSKVMQTFNKQVEVLKNTFAELALAMGEAGMFDALKNAVGALSGVFSTFNQLPQGVKSVLILLGELYIVIQAVGFVFKAAFGQQATQLLLQKIVQYKALKYVQLDLVKSTELLNAAEKAGQINSQQWVAIRAALIAGQKDMTLAGRAAVVQNEAFAASLQATTVASKGLRLALGGLTLGVTFALTEVIMLLMKMKDESEEAQKKALENAKTYEDQANSIDDLNKSFYENVFAVQDTAQAKKELESIEKKLKESIDDTTKKVDMQNATLSQNLFLLGETKKAKADKYLVDNAEKFGDAKDVLDKKATSYLGKMGSINSGAVSTYNPTELGYLGEMQKRGFDTSLFLRDSQETDSIQKSAFTAEQFYQKMNEQLKIAEERYIKLKEAKRENSDDAKKELGMIEFIKSAYGDYLTELGDYIKLMDAKKKAEAESSEGMTQMQVSTEYKADINKIQKIIQQLGDKPTVEAMTIANDQILKIKKNLYDMANKSADPKAAIQALNSVFGDMSVRYRNVGIVMGETVVNQENLDQAMKNTKEGAKVFNQALFDLEKGHKLTGEQVDKLTTLMPSLKNQIVETANGWTIEGNALKLAKNEYISYGLNAIEIQAGVTEAAQQNILNRIQSYYAEGVALDKLNKIRNSSKPTEAANDVSRDIMTKAMQSGYGSDMAMASETSSAVYNYASQLQSILDLKKLISNPSYGLSKSQVNPKEKKPKSGGSSSAGVTEPDALMEKDRYTELNMELQRTNSLIERNKALQENAETKERLKLMNEEIILLKKKQGNLANLNAEQRKERSELANGEMYRAGFRFKGSGDAIEVINAKAVIDRKVNEVNAHRNDKDKATYNRLKKEYEEMKRNLDRFIELQTDKIPSLSQDWWGLQKNINGVNEEIAKLKIEEMFKPMDKFIEKFNQKLNNLDFAEKLAGDDKQSVIEARVKKGILYRDAIIEITEQLNKLNAETEKSVVNSEEYLKKREELTNALEDNIVAFKELSKTTKEEQETAIEETQNKISVMIKKGIELEKNALQEKLNNEKDYIDKTLEERQRLYDEEAFKKQMKKETDSAKELQQKINALKYDTSLQGTNKRKALEKQLAEKEENIAEMQEDNRRKKEEQSFRDTLKKEEEKIDKTIEMMEKKFSDGFVKQLSEGILKSESFDVIKKEFPALFNELGTSTNSFFKTFENYEIKFGDTTTEKFKKNILPQLELAAKAVKDLNNEVANMLNKLNGIDYSNVEFDPNTDYTGLIKMIESMGLQDSDQFKGMYQDYQKKRAAKIYSDPKYAKYEYLIPNDYKKDPIGTGIKTAEENNLLSEAGLTKREVQIEKARLRIGELQRLYKTETNSTKLQQYSNEANNLRSKYALKDEDLKSYASKIPKNILDTVKSFSGGINKGLADKTGMYLLHGNPASPEWVLTNQQMFNLVKNLANNLSVNIPQKSLSASGIGDLNLYINIDGNADGNTVSGIKDAGRQIMNDLKKEINKLGIFK